MSCNNFKQYYEPSKIAIINENPNPIGEDKYFVHIQNTPSEIWYIAHNLNKYPSIHAITTANEIVFGEVIHLNLTTALIKFKFPITGKAICN